MIRISERVTFVAIFKSDELRKKIRQCRSAYNRDTCPYPSGRPLTRFTWMSLPDRISLINNSS